MNIGFIGAGNMGGAIIDCLVSKGVENVYVARKNTSALSNMKNIIPCKNNSEACKDIVFLAVKPVMFPTVIAEIKDSVKANDSLVVSMAAGLTTESIRDMFGFDVKIVRIMPNVNAAIGKSTTAICKNSFAGCEDMDNVKKYMELAGSVIEVAENQFSIFSALAGCSPAYVYTFADALARGAQKLGMNKKLALSIAAAAIEGSACYMAQSPEHPQELVDRVCSPGGTTIAGLCELENNGFTAAVVKAVEAVVEKDKSLNK